MNTVQDHRKAIPLKVKLQVLVRQARCGACGEKLGSVDDTRFDHRPALVARPWGAGAGDFDPPQLDPEHIEAIHVDCHLHRTVGRRRGASKTVTTRGSDVGEAARTKNIVAKQEEFRRRLLEKEPGKSSRPPSRWPKRTMRKAS